MSSCPNAYFPCTPALGGGCCRTGSVCSVDPNTGAAWCAPPGSSNSSAQPSPFSGDSSNENYILLLLGCILGVFFLLACYRRLAPTLCPSAPTQRHAPTPRQLRHALAALILQAAPPRPPPLPPPAAPPPSFRQELRPDPAQFWAVPLRVEKGPMGVLFMDAVEGKGMVARAFGDRSPMRGAIQLGDRLFQLNGEDVLELPFDELQQRMAARPLDLVLLRQRQPDSQSV